MLLERTHRTLQARSLVGLPPRAHLLLSLPAAASTGNEQLLGHEPGHELSHDYLGLLNKKENTCFELETFLLNA